VRGAASVVSSERNFMLEEELKGEQGGRVVSEEFWGHVDGWLEGERRRSWGGALKW